MKKKYLIRTVLVALFAACFPARLQASPVAHTLNIDTIGSGTVTADPDMETYPSGTEVTLTAVPNNSYFALVTWEGDAAGQEDTVTITMDADKSVTAEFGRVVAVGPYLYAFGNSRKSLASAAYEDDPFISGDGLSMYYVDLRLDLLPSTVVSIFRVDRPSLDAPWGEPMDLMQDNVNTGLNYNVADDPNLTDDGLTLFYNSLQQADIYSWPTAGRWLVVRRSSTEEEFDFSKAEWAFQESDSVQGAGIGPGAITRDGTGFIFTSPNRNAHEGSVWHAPMAPGGNEIIQDEMTLLAELPGNRYTSPEMSADLLTAVFWHPNQGSIRMVARASVDDPWSMPVTLPLGAKPFAATLSSDLTRIYFASDRAGSTPLDPRDPEANGSYGSDVYEAKMRRFLPTIELSVTPRSDGELLLTWNSWAGQTFTVEASETLELGSWIEVATGLRSSGPIRGYTVKSDASMPRRFYRIRLD